MFQSKMFQESQNMFLIIMTQAQQENLIARFEILRVNDPLTRAQE